MSLGVKPLEQKSAGQRTKVDQTKAFRATGKLRKSLKS